MQAVALAAGRGARSRSDIPQVVKALRANSNDADVVWNACSAIVGILGGLSGDARTSAAADLLEAGVVPLILAGLTKHQKKIVVTQAFLSMRYLLIDDVQALHRPCLLTLRRSA